MKAQIIEKGDGTLTVVYTAETAQEAVIVGMTSMGSVVDKLGIETGTRPWSNPPGFVQLPGIQVAVIEVMQGPKAT